MELKLAVFMYIDDCLKGIDRIMHSDIDEPINLGSNELVTINERSKRSQRKE